MTLQYSQLVSQQKNKEVSANDGTECVKTTPEILDIRGMSYAITH